MVIKQVYSFDDTTSQELDIPKNLLGGKGANLAKMTQIGLPVPPGGGVGHSIS